MTNTSKPLRAPKQSTRTFEEINQMIWTHLDERDWLPTRENARSYAISLALEANELLEHYQWNNKPVGSDDELASELADVVIYAFEFAQANELDIVDAVEDKLAKTAKKYPAEKFKGKFKFDESGNSIWAQTKIEYNKNKETL